MSWSPALQEEAAEGMHRLVILIQAAVESFYAVAGQNGLDSCRLGQSVVSLTDCWKGTAGADAAPQDLGEGLGQYSVLFYIGGMFFKVAEGHSLPGG